MKTGIISQKKHFTNIPHKGILRCMKKILIILIITIFNTPTQSRPISYPGGWTIMQLNNSQKNRIHIHYSPKVNYSLGVAFEKRSDNQRLNIQLNTLIYRHNTKYSQGNLYLKTQSGIMSDNQQKNINTIITIAGDWETRRYFTHYKFSSEYFPQYQSQINQKIRLGIAPYVANYGAIHSWFMIQINSTFKNKKTHNYEITPLIRLFKGTILTEIGLSLNKKLMLNIVKRF